jgi:hypothetical protein
MRFVFVSAMSSYPWGGSEELRSQAALHLHNQEHQVFVLVPWWPQPAAQRCFFGKPSLLFENGESSRLDPQRLVELAADHCAEHAETKVRPESEALFAEGH